MSCKKNKREGGDSAAGKRSRCGREGGKNKKKKEYIYR
jgi:hypothetical protein